MKKILVLVANYPNVEGGVALMYVHVRNKYYIQHDIDVTVLNFAAQRDYTIENIPVITLKTYTSENKEYDILVLHAANLRNHYRFLRKYEKRFPHIIFFFHGHEVLKINEAYPKPYDYTKKDSALRMIIQDCYDSLKLSIWHRYLPKLAEKADYIFVSRWFYHEFERYVRLTENDLKNHVHIINNSVGEIFEKNSYHYVGNKEYDFISIRSYMDGSKYCMDVIDALARKNPQFKFLVIGKGEFYKENKKPNNVTWLEETLNREKMIQYIEQSSCALLPTCLDAQGVMMCEMATFGIPIITSKLPVCQEVLGDLKNVAYIDNDHVEEVDLSKLYCDLVGGEPYRKTDKFGYSNTVKMEENLVNNKRGYDFITIRNMLDQSVYCIDLLCQIAECNPEKKFLLIGKGKYFDFNEKPENITWVDSYLNHDQMMCYINHSKYALMLTRRDTQGVMACELATYGIPLITSDLPICHEIFDGISKVTYISNGTVDLDNIISKIREEKAMSKRETERYGQEQTIEKEINLILSV